MTQILGRTNRRVLLVDDDPDWREAMKARLEGRFEVVEAEDGHVAKSLIVASRYDLILSDIQMPRCTGVELFRWVRQHKPTPIILMTSCSNPEEVSDCTNIEVLKKPFGDGELSKTLIKMLPWAASWEEGARDLDGRFCKISLENFITEKDVKLNVYLRLSPSKYVRIIHPGGSLPKDRIDTFRRHGVQYFYVQKDEFSKILRFNFNLSHSVTASSKISAEKKAAFLVHARDLLMEGLYINGLDREAYTRAAEFVTSGLEIAIEHDDTFTAIEQLKEFNQSIYGHSLGVSAISVMLGRAMGWNSLGTLARLAIGGIFHDIGKKEIDPEVQGKARHLLTHEERRLLESHTVRGKQILEGLKVVPADIVAITYQHHEDRLGRGYPCQISRHYVHPLAQVVSVADIFCEYCVRDGEQPAPCSAFEALRRMSAESARFEPEPFKALAQLIMK